MIKKNLFNVIGNGPSLKDFNFNEFEGKTIGMNLAFRFWERINWFPDFYSCQDIIMCKGFNNEINNLAEKYSQSFFLVRKNCGIKKKNNIDYLEDYIENYYIFRYMKDYITTGSISALWAAKLGADKIELNGIDGVVQEVTKTAKELDNNLLIMENTPDLNPNYFFNDYLRKGEIYNKPNFTPLFHLKSWILVKNLLNYLGIEVLNNNPKSRVGIFKK